jgi:hypothetical protein
MAIFIWYYNFKEEPTTLFFGIWEEWGIYLRQSNN